MYSLSRLTQPYDPVFKVFHELMSRRVQEILLVSSLYDACILEEDSRLAERIIHEYRGLNLSKPPRLTWVPSAEKALTALEQKKFDMVITMMRLADMDPSSLSLEIKSRYPDIPVVLLSHSAMADTSCIDQDRPDGIDRVFIWSGNTELLLALIKSAEDKMNAEHDTMAAGVRVILFVEDSPYYMSVLLPILYREVVSQTQAVLEEGLNEEHRLLTMRARAKILVAEDYETAIEYSEKYKPYLLGVISDVRFPKNGRQTDDAGIDLLKRIKTEISDVPCLLASAEPSNQAKAERIPATFVDKNSSHLSLEIRSFLKDYLGFGDFVFKIPDGSEVARVSNVRALEKILPDVPTESFTYHSRRNDFSRWLFARSEIDLASKMRPITFEDFDGDVERGRRFVIESLRARRKRKQKGVVVDFDPTDFDPDIEFLKLGKGSLGGKARGLAFVATMLSRAPWLTERYPDVDIFLPQSLVVTTDCFDQFIDRHNLRDLAKTEELTDQEIADRFLEKPLPDWMLGALRAYLRHIQYPLAVRSSGLLEDAHFRAYAGLYSTYMLPNDHPDLDQRLRQVADAIKLVYASTYFKGPRHFARRVGQRTNEERMAVIVQQLIGQRQGRYFYPDVSGVGQSRNYYPVARIKPEDGCATIALGLGRTVVDGGAALRFAPRYPQILPQFSTVEDILKNAQKTFYALRLDDVPIQLGADDASTLELRQVEDAVDEPAIKQLSSTYVPQEHRIRDSSAFEGERVLTFAQILKYKLAPLSDLLVDILTLAHEGMGTSVELEFSLQLPRDQDEKAKFALLQLRPMSARAELMEVTIRPSEIESAFCFSSRALGNAHRTDMVDVVYVKPDQFDVSKTVDIAREIGRYNSQMIKTGRPYLLVGPGRWGSADRWLGIPVQWADISGVGAIIETTAADLKAEPSQGSHFFHNVTSLGINYLTVNSGNGDFLDWDQLTAWPVVDQSRYIAHARLDQPFLLKVDGRKSIGLLSMNGEREPDSAAMGDDSSCAI